MIDDITNEAWNPTPAEFAEYLDREIEMAKDKLRRVPASARRGFVSLHSAYVMQRAV